MKIKDMVLKCQLVEIKPGVSPLKPISRICEKVTSMTWVIGVLLLELSSSELSFQAGKQGDCQPGEMLEMTFMVFLGPNGQPSWKGTRLPN